MAFPERPAHIKSVKSTKIGSHIKSPNKPKVPGPRKANSRSDGETPPDLGNSSQDMSNMARGQLLPSRPGVPAKGKAAGPGGGNDSFPSPPASKNLIARLASAATGRVSAGVGAVNKAVRNDLPINKDFLQMFKIDLNEVQQAQGKQFGPKGEENLTRNPQRLPEWSISISASASVNSQNASRLAELKHPEGAHIPDLTGEHRPNHGGQRCQSLNYRFKTDVDLKTQYSTWMQSADKWKDGFGRGWVGERQLGRGGMGITGLWRFEGFDGDDDYKWEKEIKHIVSKQMRTGARDGLRKEVCSFEFDSSTHKDIMTGKIFTDNNDRHEFISLCRNRHPSISQLSTGAAIAM
jgi:hypothetical protein